jgi:hypothetical protein
MPEILSIYAKKSENTCTQENLNTSQVWCLSPVIPAIPKVEVGRNAV